MSDLEPDRRFDLRWPHALSRELQRIALPPRPARGRYATLRDRRRGGWRLVTLPALSAAVVVLVSLTTFALGAGRLFLHPRQALPQIAHVQQPTNDTQPATTPSPIKPSLAPIVTAPVGTYSYSWTGSPAAPQRWVPGAVSDWDLLATTDFPSDQGGTMQGRFGPDCAAPPATHPLRALADSAYVCRGQLMTAINGGGDAPKGYGAVIFSPAQLADFGGGASTVSWQVSTRRMSTDDWWDVWLTPFDENLATPVAPNEAPAFSGPPADAIHVRMGNTVCPGAGQPATLGSANGVPLGTMFDVEVFANHKATSIDASSFQPCLETALGKASLDTPLGYKLEVAAGHVRFSVLRSGGGAPLVYADAHVDLPFTQAVVQFAHHSWEPGGCTGDVTCGPNTYQWSGVSIDPALPFTMLRPAGAATVHGTTTLRLPQPAPKSAHLRFFGLGSVRVGFDGHGAQAAVPQQGQDRTPGEASYWMPVPEGTTTITLSGTGANGLPWWVFDPSVWAP